ncbi:protein of unknown function (DUF1390) [Paramecium bursaria Chlorella virus NY2B]|uniref:Uncharacterized protein B720L n=1 Tax=Paramecium bursaria Chlorella virus NY2A TaxID=46021 RepID=A7IXP5_PBCVN|nr:hypothetical protein NY2A_B720L [Paramecium bursaria Chlorella virus NY2A]YP_001498726.1 hypothetical protein AR158_C645L [Paramecium bursaria Chlorella virus AR158]AGE54367.1 protein of unknown function (DUF1390) [Paramecium bursaria Chlorella virus IL-5-2s1]AGE58486.1 protein of unknown function (DUF1390) [Paramecium bursaria Chlorella virus NY2B]ABT15119.1 hypothetical protein NY2A_B720L [Paramecium bursaria Chlorella virus NY2A]ABU44190.1 hypothetical protein AR158_C645L [Paramecium bur
MNTIFSFKVYTCTCGFYTADSSTATKHKKSKSCKDKEIKNDIIEFIRRDAVDPHGNLIPTNITNNTNCHNQHANVINNTVIFNLPTNTLKEDMIKYLETVRMSEDPSTSFIIQMPGELLDRTRSATKFPGALTERGDKIVEKLPGGGERVMGRKKAVKVFTNEAVDALCKKPPSVNTRDYYEKERTIGKKEMTIREAVEASATNSVDFHHKTPTELKKIVNRIETHTESVMNKITKDNYQRGDRIEDF